eukprot:TRINITY_DN870_c1_g1_i2.p1 TRINITY_DN870_c1_g1~~TRINITY_DN870_c1_g1_i2.p1  ORF type:complete len:110 (+),score=5.88 TRINITY_DN870_c1_g1_i2:513-842(+)
MSTDVNDWLSENKIWSKEDYSIDESYENPEFDRYVPGCQPDICDYDMWDDDVPLQCRISKPQRVSPTLWRSVRTYFFNISYRRACHMQDREEQGYNGRPWKHFRAGRGQ